MLDWMLDIKPVVLENLELANVCPKSESGKTILRFERRVNSVRNKIGTMSLETLFGHGHIDNASAELGKLNNGGTNVEKAPHWEAFKAYCEVTNNLSDCNISDYLA